MPDVRRELDRLARAGAGMEQIRQTLEVTRLASWERDLLQIYATALSDRASNVNGRRYLESLQDEIGA
jgi:hypothetical protein